MFVLKRKGNREEVSFDKIHKRIKWLVSEPYKLNNINATQLSQKVIQNLFDGMSTSDIDNYTANLSASLSVSDRDYAILAGRIVINNCHKNTLGSFKDKMNKLYMRKDNSGKIFPLISDEFYKFVVKNQQIIESTIDYSRDYSFDFFGFRTLEKGYLLKIDEKIVERPQDLYMRVAIFIHMNSSNYKSEKSLTRIFETYELMSKQYFIHATPTLFNAGTIRPALASCFLLGTEDSLNGIMETATKCANISKRAGGIGFHFSNWRSAGALIRSTNGDSAGTIPFLRIFNDVARAFNQGGKRLGSFAAYIEPHHPDILSFLKLRKNAGDENLRRRDLF
jgi:ribonucleotide reductase alpha subunit